MVTSLLSWSKKTRQSIKRRVLRFLRLRAGISFHSKVPVNPDPLGPGAVDGVTMPILNPSNYGERVIQLKEKSIERVFFPRIYGFAEPSWVDLHCPELAVRKYVDVLIDADSDFIVTKDGAVWGKYFKPQWTKIVPMDRGLLEVKSHQITVRKPQHVQAIENGFSLCGVHCTVWAHFLVQYLPKLYSIDRVLALSGGDLTIILPLYEDLQIKEIVFHHLQQFRNLRVVVLEAEQTASCNTLYHIEHTSHISDHAHYINPFDIIIYQYALNALKNRFIGPLVEEFEKSPGGDSAPFRKLYLGRTGSRNLENGLEIENYLATEGFEAIAPHELSLKEKVRMFRECKIMAGPFSSGFTNLLFCRPGTKVLAFSNCQRAFDGYIDSIAKYHGVDVMFVTGDDSDHTIHSSYYIPLETIKAAYSDLLG